MGFGTAENNEVDVCILILSDVDILAAIRLGDVVSVRAHSGLSSFFFIFNKTKKNENMCIREYSSPPYNRLTHFLK